MSCLDKLALMLPMEDLDAATQAQIFDVLKLDCVVKVAIMRDAHLGYDLPIGGVALLRGYISPSFVGYDIGCGMTYYHTGITTEELFPTDEIKSQVYNEILQEIPVGCSSRSFPLDYGEFKSGSGDRELEDMVNSKVGVQLGTLGGGNHFIEIGETRQGYVGITIHSGSRNVGHTIGSFYMNKGRMFPLYSDDGVAYFQDMQYAEQFALLNRATMMQTVCRILDTRFGIDINENHNHAVITDEGILHRKGATSADKGAYGIIPANMRDGVYMTKGLGNHKFLCSAPHGCGRAMGRNNAKQTLSMDDFVKSMSGIWAKVSSTTLDESPAAYKEADYVLSGTDGVVVDVVDHIKPLINIKS